MSSCSCSPQHVDHRKCCQSVIYDRRQFVTQRPPLFTTRRAVHLRQLTLVSTCKLYVLQKAVWCQSYLNENATHYTVIYKKRSSTLFCDLNSGKSWWILIIFTGRRSYASAVLGVVILSVCPSVCHTGALWLIHRTYRRYFYTIWKGNPSTVVFWCQKSWRNSNGVTVGTRRCSIDWCYFQWPWVTLTTPNHPIFDILYRLSYLHSECRYRLQIW